MRRALAISALLAGLPAASCGEAPSKIKAVECRTDDDCDGKDLGICEKATCENNRCEASSLPDGKRCDDSDPITGEDACLDGICFGVSKQCGDDLGPCLMAVHDPETDECLVEPVADGVSCDDADACTQVDSCQAGECVGAEPKLCAATDDCHVDGECDPQSGECVDQAAPDGTACDDAQGCTESDVCSDGACAGEAVVCDDGLGCSADSCEPASGACVADMSRCDCVTDQDCSDGNACNGVELCDPKSKQCHAGTAVVCPGSANACARNVCVAESGACEPEPVADGASCDDADACTAVDTCQAGECLGSEAVVCAALSQCHTAGACDKVTGQCSNPERANDALCNDGNACTTTDSCQAGACVGGGQVTCQASDQCHVAGVCNTQTGACTNPNQQNGVACNDGNACSNGDACSDGVCTPSAQVVCSATDSCHLAGTCDTATGVCSNPAKNDGAPCNDGLTCTTNDLCTAGQCGGTATTCNDNIACTVDTCAEPLGGCTLDSTACACETGADCNDGNPCNGTETCSATRQCQAGTAVDCSNLDSACSVGMCSPSSGACVANPRADGASCDDDNACTGASSCQAGVCQGTSPVFCGASDQCHDAGTCNPATGQCSDPPKTNGTTCDDGSACTLADACQAGTCLGADPVVCGASDNCHEAGVCDPASGQCSNPAKNNGAACSDGSLCTQTDTCQGGSCVGASPVTCTAADQCHDAGTCDPATGACSNPAKNDGATCSDGDSCTQADSCQGGSCVGASPVTCAATDQCHDAGTCDSATGACSNPAKNDGATCSDGSLCTQTDSCQGGACVGASPVTCVATDQCHDAGVCDPASGQCTSPAKNDGAICSDGSACTQTDACQGGSCVGASPVTCVATDQCHDAGTCDSVTGACSNPAKNDGATCSDGNSCTQADSCQGGSCVGASPVTCAATDQCHDAGTCDPATGACSNPARNNGAPCSDGSLCTQTDSCQGGACVGASPVTCTATDQCHDAGVCDPGTGQCSDPAKNNDTPCNDNLSCTAGDKCTTGVCAGTAIACNDGIACSVDSCQEPAGCSFDRASCGCDADVDCDDDNACNGVETCDLATLSCQSGSAVSCTGLDNACNVGVCDTETGACSAAPRTDGTGCSDGNACTRSDACVAGACVGTNPVTCTASDQCHDAGVCDTQTGQCTDPNKNDGSLCSDGDLCTASDTCQGGACLGASPVVCTPRDQCHGAGTCVPTTGECTQPVRTGACDDGDGCTQTDTCNEGSCVGGNPVLCSALDECHDAGQCDPQTGACSDPEKENGSACSDDDACTQADSCQAGECQGANPVICGALDQCHDAGTCDSDTGQCSNPFSNTTKVCDDGNACTTGETCDGGGACDDGSTVTCPAPGEFCMTNTCDPLDGCVLDEKPAGTPCSDDDGCTQTDTCSEGSCVGGNPVVCSALDQCHDVGECDPGSGACSDPAKENGSSCSDDDACTQADSCQGGDCQGADPVVCAALDQCYEAGTCDSDTGECSNPFSNTTKACDDGNACTTGEACDGGGACDGGSTVTCPAPAEFCMTNTCDPLEGCVLGDKEPGTPCNDSSQCTRQDACVEGSCQGADPRKNVNHDWADDPGSFGAGPDSSDAFTDRDGNLHVTGLYRGTVYFDDKDRVEPADYTPLGLPEGWEYGIYWTIYSEAGAVQGARNIAVSNSTLTVNDATVHSDNSFTLLGQFDGTAYFGLEGSELRGLEVGLPTIYVAHFNADGTSAWVARFNVGGENPFTAVSLATTDDDSVVAIGDINGFIEFIDGQDQAFGSTEQRGGAAVWAAMLGLDGRGRWANRVAFPKEGTITAQRVAALNDGLGMTGTFSDSGSLGPNFEGPIEVVGVENPSDVWYMKLDSDGFYKWGGRVGAGGQDYPGDVVRVGGGMLLTAATVGAGATATDTATKQLFTTSDGMYQTHVIAIDESGELTNASLIAPTLEPEVSGATLGLQLELDRSGSYSIAGIFLREASFWSSLGFGTGTPTAPAELTVVHAEGGPLSVYVARLDPNAKFAWAIEAGGDGSGLTADMDLTGHPSQSLTVTGQFTTTAIFGDQSTEELQTSARAANIPFVVHLNSEAEYDYCQPD